jgi:beta-galactosidase
MVRQSWRSLNGAWQYTVTANSLEWSTNGGLLAEWTHAARSRIRRQGVISVPFSVESNLSGVGYRLGGDEALFYKRVVDLSRKLSQRYMLHFESVDYECVVLVNGKQVGSHKGGNLPFEFDVTALLKDGPNEFVVGVRDMMSPYTLMGKQSSRGGKIWYSASSGIRGTVWLETVPDTFIRDLKITTTSSPAVIQVEVDVDGSRPVDIQVSVMDGGPNTVATAHCAKGEPCIAPVPGAKLWNPASPFLYNLSVELMAQGNQVDMVQSYAGIRTVGKRRDPNGHYRFTLNDEFIFHYGVLDQGWWPDGGLTPPSDAAMRFDVDFVKASGFNVVRKHMKVEPRRFYAYCDRVGVMVWQDQPAAAGCEAGHTPCNDEARKVSPGNWPKMIERVKDYTAQPEAQWPEDAHQQYLAELAEMIRTLRNNPSIVVWVPFNEAWGQHRTTEVGETIKHMDPSRLVNVASGGNFWPVGDIVDRHNYPNPTFETGDTRFRDYVKVVGEFGGHTLPMDGHTWDKSHSGTFGYSNNENVQGLLQSYNHTFQKLRRLVKNGVAGAIYTQTTDVEHELNGLLTYDREVAKMSAEQLRKIHDDGDVFRMAADAVQ